MADTLHHVLHPAPGATLSPGPWLARDDGTIIAADGEYVCVLGCPEEGLTEQAITNGAAILALPELAQALRGAIGSLEFSRDYHTDLGNEEQAFAQDKLDAALRAIAKLEGR